MSVDITITLTDLEHHALAVIAYDPEDYLTNFAQVRARSAIDDTVQQLIQDAMNAGEPLPTGTKDEIFVAANLPTAREVTDAEMAALEAEETP